MSTNNIVYELEFSNQKVDEDYEQVFDTILQSTSIEEIINTIIERILSFEEHCISISEFINNSCKEFMNEDEIEIIDDYDCDFLDIDRKLFDKFIECAKNYILKLIDENKNKLRTNITLDTDEFPIMFRIYKNTIYHEKIKIKTADEFRNTI